MSTTFHHYLMSVILLGLTCLFQCKAASNVKHVSVHANPANTSSVSKLMKSLNISNPVPVLQPNVMSVTPVLLVNSLNH